MINPQSYKLDSPEWVLAKFLECWKRRAWKQMLNYVRKSWLEKHQDPSKVLRSLLNFKLISADLIQINANTGTVAVFLMQLQYRGFTFDNISSIEIKLFRESKRWGVSPDFRI